MTTRQPDPLPEATAQFALPDGRPVAVWYRWFWDVANMIPKIIAIIDNPPPVPTYELLEDFSVVIPFPSNKDYRLVLDGSAQRTITEVVSRCVSGTCTAQVKIDSTALGGTANSVSSSEQKRSHSSANVWNAGQDLVLTISSNSSCIDMTLSIKTVRTLIT